MKLEKKSCDLMVLNGPQAIDSAVTGVEIMVVDEADRELDVVLEDHGQERLLQEVAALRDERLADDADALADLGAAPPGELLVEQVLVDALALGAAYVPLDEALAPTTENFFDDCHFTDLGSDRLAEAIFPTVLKEVQSAASDQ